MREGQPSAGMAVGRFVYSMARILDACPGCARIGRGVGPCTWWTPPRWPGPPPVLGSDMSPRGSLRSDHGEIVMKVGPNFWRRVITELDDVTTRYIRLALGRDG